MTQSTPAGWYPDQTRSGTERYWDGTAWTTASRPGGQTLTPPIPPPAATTHHPQPPSAPKPWYLRWWVIALGVLVALAVIGSLTGGDKTQNTAANTTPHSSQPRSSQPVTAPTTVPTTAAAAPTTTIPAKPKPPVGPVLTAAQEQARGSAQDYLSMDSGFSRQGLIDQLSSSAGDQYSVKDATVAVDSLKENWNAQAVLSAKAYLGMSHFSCAELVDQLSSAAGAHFTLPQAQYGAKEAGAC